MKPTLNQNGEERLMTLFGTVEVNEESLPNILATLNDECIIEKPIKDEIAGYFKTYKKALEAIRAGRLFHMVKGTGAKTTDVFVLGYGVHEEPNWYNVLTDIFAEAKISPDTFTAGGGEGSNPFYPTFGTKEEVATYWHEKFYSLPRIRAKYSLPARIKKYSTYKRVAKKSR